MTKPSLPTLPTLLTLPTLPTLPTLVLPTLSTLPTLQICLKHRTWVTHIAMTHIMAYSLCILILFALYPSRQDNTYCM